jgi:hypothetical protein
MLRRALVLSVLLTACAHLSPLSDGSMLSDRLFCGLSIPGGGEVSEAELQSFIAEVVTPRFPEGFTVWRAKGQWKGGDEDSFVIEIMHPAGAEIEASIHEIADAYRTRFHQEAVMRVTSTVKMEFVK